eukprot:m.80035 g.80035  ORF g.80035 m.80035 type:complete len:230 (+) comp19339_c0_seq1:171-860(+)
MPTKVALGQSRAGKVGRPSKVVSAGGKLPKSHSSALSRRKVAITVLGMTPEEAKSIGVHRPGTAGTPADGEAAMEVPQKGPDLQQRVIALGATYSPTVHRRLDVLVASSEAVRMQTQRVRKAMKFRVPIVKLGWVLSCEAAGAWVDPLLFSWPPPVPRQPREPTPSDPAPSGKRSLESSATQSSAISATSKIEWTACYCVCHDDEDAAAFCDWCTEGHPQEAAAAAAAV